MRHSIFIMGVKLFAALDNAPVHGMRLLPVHFHNDGLGHLVGDHVSDLAVAAMGCRLLRHLLLLRSALRRSRARLAGNGLRFGRFTCGYLGDRSHWRFCWSRGL